ncbi:trimeric intracellular cation channel family protein [Paractinoplanes hotanensis]|uniref:TRIC cation channel family protein n=1 Tax=Paractinoplanes hotanensis TaxID=2906497 RepID=A0ABT0YES4_9ACTN|nr:TRIC cation channel family protein [Actinoplanes hotanensis]MCM4084300.1 TRIC cation channel family protein [Actinoplanes hotanensis]
MSVSPFQVELWIELLAAGLGGLQGALFAAGERHRRIDVLGVIVIGLAVSLGGSLLRDIVLNQRPVVIWMNWYLLVAAASAILGMVLQPVFARADWLITLLDAVVMGLFGGIGASKALSLGVGVAGALVVGVIGAIGGGMLRDVILSRPISFLQVGTLYAVAAGAGAGTLILLAEFGTPIPIAGTMCVMVTTVVRLAAIRFGWTFPEQRAVNPRIRPRRRPRPRFTVRPVRWSTSILRCWPGRG